MLNQFAFSLTPGGYLFLGKAETVRPNQTYYELVNKYWKVYRCIGNALPAPNYTRLSEGHVQRSFRRLDTRPSRTTSKQLTGQVQIRQQLETVRAVQAQLMNELSSANKRLNDMNKELMDFKEELQVANEALMLTREELQASIQARQEMERLNQLQDDFLSLASHELRTPLSAIKGNAELILRSLKSQLEVASKGGSRDKAPRSLDIEQEEHMLGRIIGQANRMNKLISEMLDMTRIRAEVLELKNEENINVVELVWCVVEQNASADNHPLALQIGQDAIVGNWDKARLEQVLDNLINNAVKYSPPNTPVTIGVEHRSEPIPEVIIWVRDEGYGISEEEQVHIFDRFYRGHVNEQHNVEGLGLGLYISHEIITRQGGRMWLESKPGAGSTFYFSLPL